MLYVTPEKYRTMGFGIDLADIEDVELVSVLERASALAEGYVAAPRQFSFFGGTMTDEQHIWRVSENPLELSQRRVWPYAWPIKEIASFRVNATNTQYVEVAPSELFINNADRYIEIVSLAFTNVGLFGAGITAMGLMQPVASITYDYGYRFEARGEILYPTDARTYRATNQFWDTSENTPVIYVNGVAALVADYTLDTTEGTVLFDNQLAAEDRVTADYDYKLPEEIRDAVGHLATYLMSGREIQSRAMGGLQSLKVGEVSIVNPSHRLDAATIGDLVPQAAWLLDGYRFISIR